RPRGARPHRGLPRPVRAALPQPRARGHDDDGPLQRRLTGPTPGAPLTPPAPRARFWGEIEGLDPRSRLRTSISALRWWGRWLGLAGEERQLLGRAGHRDVAVDGARDAVAERVGADEHHAVELQALGRGRGEHAHPRVGLEEDIGARRGDDAGDALVRGEPG